MIEVPTFRARAPPPSRFSTNRMMVGGNAVVLSSFVRRLSFDIGEKGGRNAAGNEGRIPLSLQGA